MPRLFIALSLPLHIREQLSFAQAGLEAARWIEPDDLHLTLRFFGDMDHDRADELHDALSRVRYKPFQLQLGAPGVFGGQSPRSIWVGIAPNESLNDLQRRLERLAERIGFTAERRKFTPHITIARLHGASPSVVSQYLSAHDTFDFLSFEVTGFALYSAKGSRGGGPYVIEAHYPLDAS